MTANEHGEATGLEAAPGVGTTVSLRLPIGEQTVKNT